MAAFNKLKNVLMLAFDWILYGAGVADHCQVTVTQPRFQQADSSMNNVSLTCTFSASGCSSSPPDVLWFRFLTNTHQDLCTPACIGHPKYKVHLSGNNILLEIKELTVDDSAVYICGIAFSDSDSPLSKQTGDGTVLTVTGSGKKHSNGKLIFMIIASSLLFLYSSAVLTSFVVYKIKTNTQSYNWNLDIIMRLGQENQDFTVLTGLLKPKLLKKSGKDQTTENCKINSGRKIFQAIAQELQKQRYAQHSQQPDDLEDDTVYQNR